MSQIAPEGYSTVSPYLVVSSADKTLDFLTNVLHATEIRRFPGEAGKIMHAEARLGDSMIMVADAMPPEWPAVAAHVHVYVADVDATYREALAAGATSVQEPVQKDDEDKRGGVKDAGGTTWWIATRVS